MSPVLTESEQERLFQIYGTLEHGQFYAVQDILRSKAFLWSFALNLRNMASNGRDNAEEKIVGDGAHVVANEGESRLS